MHTALSRFSNLRLINLKINEAPNLFGYRDGTPLAGGSTGLRWYWLNYLAGAWKLNKRFHVEITACGQERWKKREKQECALEVLKPETHKLEDKRGS